MRCAVVEKRFLEKIELAGVFAQAFDGLYLRIGKLADGREAGTNRLAVYKDGARAAIACIATDFRAGEVKLFAYYCG